MRVLLDTNIIIHREASRVVKQEIGLLFNWLDKLHYDKCVHPVTVAEIKKYENLQTVRTFVIKLDSYIILKTEAPTHPSIKVINQKIDKTENDINDSKLLNELINNRVDILITEDNGILTKAEMLNLQSRVFSIESFLGKVISENPELIDYNVLSVKKDYFGNINLQENFFDVFREDYDGFDKWFNRKADEPAYICKYGEELGAFLYLKVEGEKENYSDINPTFPPKKRLKIGTFKISMLGLNLSERFFKIIFDNALTQKVDEIYVTIFAKRTGQKLLITQFEQFGFKQWGIKRTQTGDELVLVRDFTSKSDKANPLSTFPFLSKRSDVYFVSIYPEYHTELFPDSILKTESPDDFVENQPHRNSIRKVYISHSFERNINTGDIIVFYRTGTTPGRKIYEGVVTTIGIVESINNNIKSENDLIKACYLRSVLPKEKLIEFWNRFPKLKPFVVNFLYAYSFPKRPILKDLIELGVIEGPDKLPRGFGKISWDNLLAIIKKSGTDESIIGN
jgi:predicted nucleic acid-binding protein